jgi:hypothetical protein
VTDTEIRALIIRPSVKVIVCSVLVGMLMGPLVYISIPEPGYNPRVGECAQAMDSEILGHPNDACTGLTKDEKREAAYRWARETGRLP